MIEGIKKYLPENYLYKKSEWYQEMKKKQYVFRRRLLTSAFVAATFILLSFIISDLIRYDFSHTPNYILPFVSILFCLVWIIITKKIRLMTGFAFILCCIGEFAGFFLPAARQVNIIVFFCFPVLSILLLGSKKGFAASFVFITGAIVLYYLQDRGILVSPNTNLTEPQFFMSIAAFVLSSVLVFVGEYQNESYLNDLVKKVIYDEATGLPNRIVLENSVSPAKRSLFAIVHLANSGDLGLIFGYELSDDFLSFLSKQLIKWKETFNYQIFRLRGNEFGILMPFDGKDIEEGEIILHDIQTLLQKDPVPFKNSELRLNLKFGAVIIDGTNGKNFLSLADIALKEGIKRYKNINIYIGENDIKDSAYESTALFTTLMKNHEEKLFKIYYQPVVNSFDGNTAWYESLLRVKNNGIYESPLAYLPIAESTGMGDFITDFIVESAFEMCDLNNMTISVNISFNDMLRKHLIEFILEKCRNRKGSGNVIFEILERSELSEIEGCRNFINKVRDAGCLVAIDDFGSGYSNFSNLLNVPTDIIKIDGSLIRKILCDNNARNMVLSIINYCKQSGKKVVAEFVENMDLACELKELKVDYLQGYFYGRPEEIGYYRENFC